MISYLNIKNIALIKELSIELKDGLNILSGETGAGKSIIIDSINFVLGDRADRSLIRYGERSARVEVVFEKIVNYAEIKAELEGYGIECDDDTVIVTRMMTDDRSECRINGRIVTLSTLRSIVSGLVDIHSQNEHQSLMKPSNHIEILDAFAPEAEALKEEFRLIVAKYRAVCEEIEGFMSADERERKMDILKFQIEEIDGAGWTDEEEESMLNSQKKRFYNAQKIIDSVAASANALNEENIGVISGLKVAMLDIRPVLKYDERISEVYERLESLVIETGDIVDTLYSLLEESCERINIEVVERRLEQIKLLQRKYGATIERIAEFRSQAEAEMNVLADAESRIAELTREKSVLEKKIEEKVHNLHEIRVAVSNNFQKAIADNLNELGMKNCLFEVKIDYPDDVLSGLNNNGADTVEFLLSPNIGEPLKPLHKIASGGEMSRLMLAIKNIIAEVDKIGTLIFDEIDTGISGVIAKVVACKLYDIAKSRQVIAITHLPQLASMADCNFLISKRVENGSKTVTSVSELKDNAVYEEIMRLTGAVENSEIGLSNARELKDWANAYKTRK